jgi:hypothetical protein
MPFSRQRLGAADIVLVEGVAAVDDDVALGEQAAQGADRVFGDLAGRQHHPDRARRSSGGKAFAARRLVRRAPHRHP